MAQASRDATGLSPSEPALSQGSGGSDDSTGGGGQGSRGARSSAHAGSAPRRSLSCGAVSCEGATSSGGVRDGRGLAPALTGSADVKPPGSADRRRSPLARGLAGDPAEPVAVPDPECIGGSGARAGTGARRRSPRLDTQQLQPAARPVSEGEKEGVPWGSRSPAESMEIFAARVRRNWRRYTELRGLFKLKTDEIKR